MQLMKHSNLAAAAIVALVLIVLAVPDISLAATDSPAGSDETAADKPPAIMRGPFLAAGTWPMLPTSAENALVFDKDYDIVWTFSDDQKTCNGACVLQAEYQISGSSRWTRLPVNTGPKPGFAHVTVPVRILDKDTRYAFRFSVTDCAGQTVRSAAYYFAVPPPDTPPAIGEGPFLSSGQWPVLPLSQSHAVVIKHSVNVLWNFSDDYVACSGLCTHRARYRKAGEEQWVWLDNIVADPTGKKYAYVELPVAQLQNGTYMFRFDVQDCARQRTESGLYYFEVDKPQ